MLQRLFVMLLIVGLIQGALFAESPIDVPRLDSAVIDGAADDWGEAGFRIDIMSDPSGKVWPPDDLDARCRLAWDEKGLLVLVQVRDSIREESLEPLGRADSVELFISTGPGSNQRYQFTVTPGVPDAQMRSALTDRRGRREPRADLTAEAGSSSVEGGYLIEARLPWENLGIVPQLGAIAAFQVRVNDVDTGPRKSIMWPAKADTYNSPGSVVPIELADEPVAPVQILATCAYEQGLSRMELTLLAPPELAGRMVHIRQGDTELKQGQLLTAGGRATALLRLPFPAPGSAYPELRVRIGQHDAASFTPPDPDDARARALMELPVALRPNVFNGPELPRADFESPLVAQQILGPYDVKTTYYDQDYNIVTSADRPGRYGAVIEFIPASSARKIRRFRTIYRPARPLDFWSARPLLSMGAPQTLRFEPATVQALQGELDSFLANVLESESQRDSFLPVLIEGMSGMIPAGQTVRRNSGLEAQDRQWWVGLKRKLNGWDQRWPKPFIGPVRLEGAPARALREGTAREAGMSPEGVARIDAICQEWASKSDQGFSICIARHGVIVLHKAYGQRGGRPMTVTDKSWTASITKAMSGTIMMMLVDQGLVDLDDTPIETYLPAFAGEKVQTSATIHHLYTHTAGLWGHWGDSMHDFDEVVGEYYPRLKVGMKHEYNGASQAIGSKIIEAVSGEALPLFYLKHLLEPLGMEHTDVMNSSSDAASTALDMARFGQMLLNRGAYGQWRFMRPQTFDLMLPQKLTKLLGPDTGVEWGMGITWFQDEPLGPKTIGHGAASSAMLRINAEKDIVLVMTRDSAGTFFNDYQMKFRQAVADAVIPDAMRSAEGAK